MVTQDRFHHGKKNSRGANLLVRGQLCFLTNSDRFVQRPSGQALRTPRVLQRRLTGIPLLQRFHRGAVQARRVLVGFALSRLFEDAFGSSNARWGFRSRARFASE